MTVLKKFEPRVEEIKQLEWILDQLTVEQEDIKRKALVDLKRVRGGDRGKFNASEFIENLYAGRDDVVIMHDLRLGQGEQASQLDHLVIGCDGRVTLFETKNFTNGLKVGEDGQFAYWNRFKRSFYSINSPLDNAEKNKLNLKPKLETMLGKMPAFQHFIVVDYRAKLIKPDTGYDMIVRSDEVKKRLEADKPSDQGGLMASIKRLFGFGSPEGVPHSQLVKQVAPLVEAHQPLIIDYVEKYGLNLDYDPTKVEVKPGTESSYQPEARLQRLTLAKLAREMGIHSQDLQARLVEQGLLEKRGFKTFVSDKGREAGIQFRKGQRGIFFLLPTEMAKDPALQTPAKSPVENAEPTH
ncbi:nuclease-related domain-containing protein [Thiomicrospira microaerophila]|uniref:nuclease-related domain-containing protein n=1 Tax=Thiomicrospira microaerophila TaxID=406020 RepID=UPI0005C88B00|nr:nuclease-related domain-containing protein [Thiomicrospira microaerophila]